MARTTPPSDEDAGSRLGQALLDALGELPASRCRPSTQPAADSQRLIRRAAAKAALAAGTLALPLGPLGWLTVLPEMLTVWRLQARLANDIAALHGRPTPLRPEELLVALFSHRSGRILRELLLQVGERSVVQVVSRQALQLIALRLGAGIARRVAGRGLARWLPVAGAVGLGAWAFMETRQVGAQALSLFGPPAALLPAPADDAHAT